MSLLIAIDYVGQGLPAKHAVVATGAFQLTDRRLLPSLRDTQALPPPALGSLRRKMSSFRSRTLLWLIARSYRFMSPTPKKERPRLAFSRAGAFLCYWHPKVDH